jgi:hypothetical protein
MKSIIALLSLVALSTGCVTTQQAQRPTYWEIQAQNLRQAYDSGQITTNDYYARMNELQALAQQDKARQQQATMAFIQQQNQIQQQQQMQQQRRTQQQQNYFNNTQITNPNWNLQYNPMQGNWQYAPPGSSPKYNPMENKWELAP